MLLGIIVVGLLVLLVLSTICLILIITETHEMYDDEFCEHLKRMERWEKRNDEE